MCPFTINHEENGGQLPAFTITVGVTDPVAIYSDAEMQGLFLKSLKGKNAIAVSDFQDGLYDRLTVGDNIKFFAKWFGCKWSFAELLVKFQLHLCVDKRLKKCTPQEIRRIHFLRSYLMQSNLNVFVEPIHGMDIGTMNVFMEMLGWLSAADKYAVVLVSNMEHAVLLGSQVHQFKDNGLQEIEMEESNEEQVIAEYTEVAVTAEVRDTPSISRLYKIPAKTGDKVILFDPTEIDYIESQEGKAQLVINDEHFTIDTSLAQIERKLEMYGFYRCHRSYIVNLQKVREIITWSKNTYSLRLQNRAESTIPLSRTKVQEIQEIFSL